jgi:hypothetical protein
MVITSIKIVPVIVPARLIVSARVIKPARLVNEEELT